MFFRTRLKGIDDDLKVYISNKDVDRLFPFPKFNKNQEIEALVKAGELKITKGISKKGHSINYYEALKPGMMDISTIKTQPPSNDPLIVLLKKNLMSATLKTGTPATPYFSAFIRFREKYLDLFFTEDNFCGRIHTPITNLPGESRKHILIDGKRTVSYDVSTMQPLLLGMILKDQIGPNEFSEWIDNGEDIYVILQNKAHLSSREEAKKHFFEILYSKPNDELVNLFGESNWISWINDYKSIEILENPHTKAKPHSNLAWLLQTREVKLMRMVWQKLLDASISLLTVHDEIIVPIDQANQAEEIMHEELGKVFFKYQVRSSEECPSETSISIPQDLIDKVVSHCHSYKAPYDINDPGDLESLVNGFIFETGIDVEINTYRTVVNPQQSRRYG